MWGTLPLRIRRGAVCAALLGIALAGCGGGDGGVEVACKTSAECDDGNPCTDDVCVEGGCGAINNTAACDDGVFCNGADSCAGGRCSAHVGDPCISGDECADACDETAGDCFVDEGMPCTDEGNDCTDNECDGAGACVAVDNDDACDDGNPCTDDTCSESGCVFADNTAACDDGLFCNGADSCTGGSCSAHAGDPCVSGGECADVCDEAAGDCFADEGLACTEDGNECTDDVCDGAGTCAAVDNAAACDDGLFCNGADMCAGGSCLAHAGDPCASGGECADGCDEAADDCFGDEGLACTDDGNGCTDNLCNSAGVCEPVANMAACDDGAVCTSSDACQGGMCVGTPDSGNPMDPCVAPTVTGASVLTSTTVRIRFSQAMDPSTTGAGAANLGNYCIKDFDGDPIVCTATSDFTISSVTTVDSRTFDLVVSAPMGNVSYTVVADVQDAKGTDLGVPGYADFAGQEPLRVISARALTDTTVELTFSKALLSSPDTPGSADCTGPSECDQRYQLIGPTSLGSVTSAVVHAAPEDDSVVLTHANAQGGGVYTVLAANAADGDGFDDAAWGAIKDSYDVESLASAPEDRAGFSGLGSDIIDFEDGPVLFDPFGDGSTSSFLFVYADKLYLGPNDSGTGAVRSNGDGSSPQSITFDFFQDTNTAGGSTSDNSSTPYQSIGSAACTGGDAPECGPDNEDGRGLFASGLVASDEWLVIGGSRSGGNLDYVYMTEDVDTSLNFKYVDISTNMGGQTKGFSALGIVSDRLYLGFPDSGGKRPYLVSILNVPDAAAPGLDAVQNGNGGAACDPGVHDSCYLDAVSMPDIGKDGGNPAASIIVDFFGSSNDLVYLGNNGGLVRSTTNVPLDYGNHPGDWTAITPSAAEYSAKTSIATSKVSEIDPKDRAWPQFAVHKGLVYLARNTTDGPQLWRCDPTVQSGPAPATAADCDSDDWTLIAANATGDTALSQLDNPNNSHISVLVANGDYLYVGYDNAVDGVLVFRSNATVISASSDFEGDAGCTPPCTGIGGDGFGTSATNVSFFDAKSLNFGGMDFLYVMVGDRVDPASVYRTQN